MPLPEQRDGAAKVRLLPWVTLPMVTPCVLGMLIGVGEVNCDVGS